MNDYRLIAKQTYFQQLTKWNKIKNKKKNIYKSLFNVFVVFYIFVSSAASWPYDFFAYNWPFLLFSNIIKVKTYVLKNDPNHLSHKRHSMLLHSMLLYFT